MYYTDNMLTLALLLAAATDPAIDGTRLRAGTQCFALTREGTAIGATRQTVTATTVNGQPAWDIVIHQQVAPARFDMRDHFVVRQSDLTPISLDSRRSGIEHARVTYADGKITAVRPDKPATETAFTGKIWDGNLWGLTFAALPLAEGAHFELPFYHYDKGLDSFVLDVVGSETVQTPAGPVEAWTVELESAGRKVRYQIGKADHAELGNVAGPFGQRLGGDCSAIPG